MTKEVQRNERIISTLDVYLKQSLAELKKEILGLYQENQNWQADLEEA